MKALAYLIFTFFTILTSYSCNNPTDTPADKIPAGSRDYEWTVDTLKIPEGRTLPARIWGTESDNIWAVGPAYMNAYCLWHYNGTKWNNYDVKSFIDPWGIYGATRNDIWMGSSDGNFWHYDGSTWGKIQKLTIPDFQPFIVQDIIGDLSNNIYAVGFADSVDGRSYKGVIMRYNGTWKQVNIPTIPFSLVQIFYLKESNEYLIKGISFKSSENKLFLFNGLTLKEIYSSPSEISLNSAGDQVFISMDRKVYRYHNSELILFKDFSNTQYLGALWGRTENDFFTINSDGIGHYNGNDLITIFPKWNNEISSRIGIVFKEEVFFIWIDSYLTFVIHGKLKNNKDSREKLK